jgi:DNA-binding response OmpR family regulator/AraC-like DNA-binding protein
LWIDDDPSMNRVAERLLPPRGFDLTVAVTEASAMRAADDGAPDVILLDQRLPPSPDLEMLRRLRKAGDRTPVVILTGHESLDAALEALKLGVTDYLVKPAHNERILAALRIAVRAGVCEVPHSGPAIELHPDASLALVAVFFNLTRADEGRLRTQLAWALSDERVTFLERVAAMEALTLMFAPVSDAEKRLQVEIWLRRGLGPQFLDSSPAVRAFVKLITTDAPRTWHSKTDALVAEARTTMAELSRSVHRELGASPGRCRLIGHLTPALRELAQTNEQVAQVAYKLGYNLPSAFDNVFKKLFGKSPRAYRELLAGVDGAMSFFATIAAALAA